MRYRYIRVTGYAIKATVFVAGVALLANLGLALVGMPAPFRHWITARDLGTDLPPDYVVVFGGGGIPSESGLIRSYHAAWIAQVYSNATVVVALPGDEKDPDSALSRMIGELVMRGVKRERVRAESRGRHTYEQAVQVRALLGASALADRVLLVTSPYHLRRAVMCFRSEGFTNLAVWATYGEGVEPDLGGGQFARYRFWNNLEFQLNCQRELCAMAYYKLRGWL